MQNISLSSFIEFDDKVADFSASSIKDWTESDAHWFAGQPYFKTVAQAVANYCFFNEKGFESIEPNRIEGMVSEAGECYFRVYHLPAQLISGDANTWQEIVTAKDWFKPEFCENYTPLREPADPSDGGKLVKKVVFDRYQKPAALAWVEPGTTEILVAAVGHDSAHDAATPVNSHRCVVSASKKAFASLDRMIDEHEQTTLTHYPAKYDIPEFYGWPIGGDE